MDARERGIGYALCLEPLDAASGGNATSGHSAITFTSGKRSIEAKAVRGSTMVTS